MSLEHVKTLMELGLKYIANSDDGASDYWCIEVDGVRHKLGNATEMDVYQAIENAKLTLAQILNPN